MHAERIIAAELAPCLPAFPNQTRTQQAREEKKMVRPCKIDPQVPDSGPSRQALAYGAPLTRRGTARSLDGWCLPSSAHSFQPRRHSPVRQGEPLSPIRSDLRRAGGRQPEPLVCSPSAWLARAWAVARTTRRRRGKKARGADAGWTRLGPRAPRACRPPSFFPAAQRGAYHKPRVLRPRMAWGPVPFRTQSLAR